VLAAALDEPVEVGVSEHTAHAAYLVQQVGWSPPAGQRAREDEQNGFVHQAH
jgi:hypothetical protein